MPIGGVRAGYLSVRKDAIPDSVVDNLEAVTGDPVGPYDSNEDLTTYYTGDTVDMARNSSSPIKDSVSIERTGTGSAPTAIWSNPGDGLLNYPADGGTVSLITETDPFYFSVGVLGAASSDSSFDGYVLFSANPSDHRISRYDDGSRTDLESNSTSVSTSANLEYVLSVPATGNNTIEASIWTLDGNFNRDTRQFSISTTDSTYAGNRGAGWLTQSSTTTGVFADELRKGRSI